MIESILRRRIKEEIHNLLEKTYQLSRIDIINQCSQLASEPTIQAVLKDLISEGMLEESETKTQKGSNGGRPKKFYQLKVEYESLDGICISCRHWGKTSPNRVLSGASTDFWGFREDEGYLKWCEIHDKPMYHDEYCLLHDTMESLYTFTYFKNAKEKPVGFNGRVSIDLIDGVYIAKIYEQDAFLVIQSITDNGIHQCYRIYPNQTQTPYPCNIKNCTVEFNA